MRLVGCPGRLTLAWFAAFGVVSLPAASFAHHSDTEPELLAHLAKENNPANKAKIEIRLGSLKLDQAATAYGQDQLEGGAKLLDSYLSWMKQAWDLLHQSGRDAGRRPQGFKDLDIALREDMRKLADLKIHTPFADRGPVEHISAETDALHTQVLSALFPGGQLQDSDSATPANPKNEPVSALRPKESPP
jgi:hypothetical protein